LATELGKRLKEAREEKNINLEDLQKITKIQKRYLVGIEEGNYSSMPGKFYVRAFIKQYAEAVGLDPDEILEEYKGELPQSSPDHIPEQLSRVKSRKQISPKGSKFLDMVPMLLLILFIIGGLFALWWFLQNREVVEEPETTIENAETEYEETKEDLPTPNEDEQANEAGEEKTDDSKVADPDQEKEQAQEEEEPTVQQELSLVESSGNNAIYELKNVESFVAEVSATPDGETWIAINNRKGHRFFYNMMKDGQTEKFDLSEEAEVIFNIGRTTETKIKINGEEFEFPVNPKDAVTQTITIRYSPNQE